MPRAYSSDLRERLTAAVAAGMSRNEAADVFSVARKMIAAAQRIDVEGQHRKNS